MRAIMRTAAVGILLSLSAAVALAQEPGEDAPDLVYKPDRGDEVRFSELYRHRILVLYYWSSFETRSKNLLPTISRLAEKYARTASRSFP